MLEILADRTYRHLFLAQVVALLGTGLATVALGLLAFGALIELCQRAVGYRSAEWLDLAADAAGILAGLGIALVGAGGWCQRVEAWLGARTG